MNPLHIRQKVHSFTVETEKQRCGVMRNVRGEQWYNTYNKNVHNCFERLLPHTHIKLPILCAHTINYPYVVHVRTIHNSYTIIYSKIILGMLIYIIHCTMYIVFQDIMNWINCIVCHGHGMYTTYNTRITRVYLKQVSHVYIISICNQI